MTAREFDPACEECNRRHMRLMWARGDFGNLRRKARGGRAPGHGFAEKLKTAKARVAEAETAFEGHAAEVHPDGFGTGPGTTIARMAKPKEPKPIPEGKVECDHCHKVVSVSVDGLRLRTHNDRSGFPCPNRRVPGVELHVTAPPVVLSPEPQWRPDSKPRATAGPRRDPDDPARLDVGSSCRECHRWLPGERSLCGRCSVLQGRAS